MSLLLNGSKTVTIAGTEMQCIEIYTGESYTLPLSFVDNTGNAINCTVPNNWALATSAKFYTASDITYPTTGDTIILGNLTLDSPQPSTGANTYSVNLVAAFSNASAGLGYLYIPSDLTGGTGAPNATPVISASAVNTAAPSTVVVVTLTVSRQSSANASLADVNKEPIGMIVRYQ
jgi:hypothetical protein